mmetsp:Transcript_77426/g.206725  ORF Transcript_77426/g.206725 Transcript_77426/m.206725 type:complete len:212 (-) Transcript_77426:68-703(-)
MHLKCPPDGLQDGPQGLLVSLLVGGVILDHHHDRCRAVLRRGDRLHHSWDQLADPLLVLVIQQVILQRLGHLVLQLGDHAPQLGNPAVQVLRKHVLQQDPRGQGVGRADQGDLAEQRPGAGRAAAVPVPLRGDHGAQTPIPINSRHSRIQRSGARCTRQRILGVLLERLPHDLPVVAAQLPAQILQDLLRGHGLAEQDDEGLVPLVRELGA